MGNLFISKDTAVCVEICIKVGQAALSKKVLKIASK